MDNSITPQDLGLSNEVLTHLETYDDFLNFYVQIDQAVNGFSWMKADALKEMENRFGESSLKAMSSELGENYSTLVSYIRVSRAFPVETRDQGASFSLHFQASFADSYSQDSRDFDGVERFKWLEKALDDNLSTRSLAREIQESKQPVVEEGHEPSPYKRIAEELRRDINIIAKDAINGNEKSQNILEIIKRTINEYRT